jgi:excisionase family DNA binding protein
MAVKMPARPGPRPPTEFESRLALESSRQLGPSLADLLVPDDGNGSARTAELVVHVQGRPASEPMVIPAAVLRLLGYILTEMAQGNAITLTPIHAELTSKQAADLLNVSRPFLCRLLDSGDIPHRKVGRHRRVKFIDLMDYKSRTDEARSQSLDDLAAQAQELGMGY